MSNNFEWAEGMACAVTAADAEGVIRYMNRRARETYRKHGDLIGRSLFDCHGERAAGIIRRLLKEGGTNAYTIEKERRKSSSSSPLASPPGFASAFIKTAPSFSR